MTGNSLERIEIKYTGSNDFDTLTKQTKYKLKIIYKRYI